MCVEVDYLCRWSLGCQETAQKYTLSFDILAKESDVRVLKLAGSLSILHPLGSIVKDFLGLETRIVQLSIIFRKLEIRLQIYR